MNVNTALDILKKKGYKFTEKRQKMAQIFAEENRYLSAKTVHELISDDYPSLSLDTVYRNIRLFEDVDILESTELNGEKHYRFKCSYDHHHHIICTDCGKVRKIDMCPMDAVFGAPEGFSITGHRFEIYGHCDDCKS